MAGLDLGDRSDVFWWSTGKARMDVRVSETLSGLMDRYDVQLYHIEDLFIFFFSFLFWHVYCRALISILHCVIFHTSLMRYTNKNASRLCHSHDEVRHNVLPAVRLYHMMREIKSVWSVRLMPNAHVLLRHFGGQLLGSATRSAMELEIGYAGGLSVDCLVWRGTCLFLKRSLDQQFETDITSLPWFV